jgi:hypothetical protein
MLNYTTQVPANKTIAQIQEILQKHGARSILTDLDSNGITALSFKVATKQLCTHPEGTICAACGGKGIIEVLLGIRLPADVQATLRVLKRTAPPRYGTEEHARNVAWRNIKDWIEAQFAFAIHDFADYRKETESWDSQVDGLITANMNKKLEGVA